jgi:hypothetical protein
MGEMMSAFHDAVQGRDDERISAMSDFDARISPSQGRGNGRPLQREESF